MRSIRKAISPYHSRWGRATIDIGDEQLKFPYAQHEYVYRCVRDLAGKAASVPLGLYQGMSDNARLIESGPLYKVFARPNSLWSGNMLMEATATHLQLSGNAVWVMDREDYRREPREIWCFGHNKFKPNFVPNSWEVSSWDMRSKDGVSLVTLAPWQIVFFRLFNPYSEFWGLPPLAAARRAIDQDWWASKYNEAFFKNGGDPGGIIRIKEGRLNKQQRDQLLSGWTDHHQGAEKAFKIGILDGDAEYQQLTTTHKDMAFIEQQRMTREKVCTVFGVPPSVVGIKDGTHKAVQDRELQDYWGGTIVPLLQLIENALRAQFFFPLDNEQTWCEFDLTGVAALQENINEQAQTARVFYDMNVPFTLINERLKLGFERFEGDDVPGGPLAALLASTQNTLASGGGDGAADDEDNKAHVIDVTFERTNPRELAAPAPPNGNTPAATPALPRGDIELPHTPEQKAAWVRWIKALKPTETRFNGELRTYLNTVAQSIERMLESARNGGAVLAEELGAFDLDPAFGEKLRLLAGRQFNRVATAVKPIIESNIAGAGISFNFQKSDPRIVNFLRRKENKVVENVWEVGLRDKVKSTVVEAARQGQTISEMQDTLMNVVGTNRNRSLAIARTETAQAANGLEFESEKIAGIKKHMWIAALDEFTRDTHIDAMGLGPIPVGQIFGATGCRHPGDMAGPVGELVNCRCSLMSVE